MKYSGKLILIIFVGLVLANLGLATAWAHANYVRSDPPANSSLPAGQPPKRVQVWFSEALEPKFSELQIFDNQRQRVDNGDSQVPSNDPQSMIITLKPNLPDGPYTVIYKNTSAEDGHVLKNSFAFVVGAGPLPAPDAAFSPVTATEADDNFNFWGVALRWLNYLGAATLIGGIGWLLLVWQPTLRKVSDRIGQEQLTASRVARQRGNVLLTVALALLGVGWLSWLLYQGTRFASVSLWELLGSKAFGDLFGSRFGTVWLIRLGLLILAALIFIFLIAKTSWPGTGLTRRTRFNLVPDVDPPAPAKFEAITTSVPSETATSQAEITSTNQKSRTLGYWLLLLCGAAIMLTNSLNSHAAANNSAWLLIPLDWLHLMSTGFWVGGLFYLALAMPPALAALRPGTGDRTRVLAALIPNFSYIGIISVSILLVTGSIQAAFHLGSVDDLLNSGYGLALSIKLGVVAILLLFGAYHLLKVSPAMSAYARRKGEKKGAGSLEAGKLQFQFRRTVRIEAVIAVILLGLVGSLTSFAPPAGNVAPGGLVLRGQAADLSYVLQLNPAEIGTNNFNVTLTQSNGQSLTQVGAVVLRLNMIDMDMGTQEIELKAVPNLPGHFQIQGQILSMSGQWHADLIVRRDGQADATAPVTFKIKG